MIKSGLCRAFAAGFTMILQLLLTSLSAGAGPSDMIQTEEDACFRPYTNAVNQATHASNALDALALEVTQLFVDANAGADTNDGTEGAPWRTITHALQSVTGAEQSPVIINVAAGTYSASTNGEAFPLNMKSFVSLQGEGREATILDAEDSSNVITISAIAAGPSLDGFTITGGNSTNGGGIFSNNSSITVSNNLITGCFGDSGAGVYCQRGEMLFSQNEISGNAATGRLGFGGAMFISLGTPQIVDNEIGDNEGDSVGGLYIYRCSPIIQMNTISGNISTDDGGICGGIYIDQGSPEIRDNTIVGNGAIGE
ncbi:right-handed parallel beta-helix repeat-containing protein, partial [bacterium]|nr:right-handed parallel beta-helix repeat-containing protein [bacterium]